MNPTIRTRGYLPHWESESATYFVTFRLADSLPRELMDSLNKQRTILARARIAGSCTEADRARIAELRELMRRAERCLDRGLGQSHMQDSRVATIVGDAIQEFQGTRYELIAWCVMPNHVHAVFSPIKGHTLAGIMHSWKSYSAQKANGILNRSGRFWQREYFDHLVRNEASLAKIAKYVLDNPEKAGLKNWTWRGVGGK